MNNTELTDKETELILHALELEKQTYSELLSFEDGVIILTLAALIRATRVSKITLEEAENGSFIKLITERLKDAQDSSLSLFEKNLKNNVKAIKINQTKRGLH